MNIEKLKEPKILYNYYESKKIKSVVSMKNGFLHNDSDEPSVLEYFDVLGNKPFLKRKAYYYEGILYRPFGSGKPCEFEYYDTSTMNLEKSKRVHFEYYRNDKGELHRDVDKDGNDQPAVIERYLSGLIKMACYYQNGKLQRTNNIDEPSIIQYYDQPLEQNMTRKIEFVLYAQDGLYHRDPLDGVERPAHIKYDYNQNIAYKGYFKHGVKLEI